MEIWDETHPCQKVRVCQAIQNESLLTAAARHICHSHPCRSKKIQVIKEVRTATSLGLKEAKDLVDDVPSVLGPFQAREAIEAHRALQTAGANVRL